MDVFLKFKWKTGRKKKGGSVPSDPLSEKWRVGSPDLLHIDTFSKNNNSYSRACDSCSGVRDSCSRV